jgi:hypothetical protein
MIVLLLVLLLRVCERQCRGCGAWPDADRCVRLLLCRYSLFLPLYELWKQYTIELLRLNMCVSPVVHVDDNRELTRSCEQRQVLPRAPGTATSGAQTSQS